MYNAQTSSSSQKYLLYFFSSLVLYINHLALKGTLVSFFDLCMHIAYAHHLVYVLYRTETAGYMIPSLIYVLYRTETAGYMVPSLIWGIIGILLNAASMIWQVVPQTLKE